MALDLPPLAFVQTYAFAGAGMCRYYYERPKRMSANFDKAFDAIVGVEGGYVNDPRDPGGETKYGISKRSYPNEDIPNLTLARAKEIYLRDFWTPIRGDELPWPLSLFVFDGAVNHGLGAAIRTLQKTVGVAQDGSFGAKTVKAVAKQEPRELCALFMADRALRYQGTRNFDINGRGWLKRLFAIAMEVA